MSGRSKRKQNKRGFTLAEVVLGITLVTLVATVFLVMFTAAYTSFFSLGAQTRAVNQVQEFFEDYYANPATIDSNEWQLVTTGLDTDLVAAYPGYQRFYDEESVVANGQTVTKVTAIVYYWNNNKRVEVSAFAP